MNDSQIASIILTWRKFEDTKACIESLLLSSLKINNIIIVDNASNDDSWEKLKKTYKDNPNIYFISNSANLGFAKGINIGIKYALKIHVDYIVLLNQDTVVDSEFVSECIKFMKNRPQVGIVGPRIYYFEKPEKIWHSGGYFSKLRSNVVIPEKNKFDKICDNNPKKVRFLSGCALFVRREVFKIVGMFDETYFFYDEDTDFSFRVEKANFELWYLPKAKVWHKIGDISKERTSSFVMYHRARSHIILLKKNFSKLYFIYALFLHFSIYFFFRVWQIIKGSKSLSVINAWFKGTLDGLRPPKNFTR